MVGPNLIFFTDEKQWRSFLKGQGVWPWYAKIHPAFRPGAYVRTDNDGNADSDDTIRMGPREWGAALAGERWAVELLYHEWLHTLVYNGFYAQEMGITPEEQAWLREHCSHPSTAIEGIKHAKRTGFRTNAFTRFLRWNPSNYRRADFEKWWATAPERATAYEG